MKIKSAILRKNQIINIYNMLLSFLLCTILIGCGSQEVTKQPKFNYLDMVQFDPPRKNQDVIYRTTEPVKTSFDSNFFEVVYIDKHGKEEVQFRKNMIWTYMVRGEEAYARFLDGKSIRNLESLYYFPARGAAGYKLMETSPNVYIEPDLEFLFETPYDNEDKILEYKRRLYKIPESTLVAEYDFSKEIEHFPPYGSYDYTYEYIESENKVKLIFEDGWGEVFGEFIISLSDFSYKKTTVAYSKIIEPLPEDARFVEPYNVGVPMSTSVGDGLTRIKWGQPHRRQTMFIEKRKNELSSYRRIHTISDVVLYFYIERYKKIFLVVDKKQENFNNDLVLFDPITLESEKIGESTLETMISPDGEYFVYHKNQPEDPQRRYDCDIIVYSLNENVVINDLDPSQYIPENYKDPYIDNVSIDYPRLKLLLTGDNEKDYQITVNLESGEYELLHVNQYEKPELDLPSLK